MDLSTVAAVSTVLAQQQVGAQAQTLMLRKALDIAANNAMTLIDALPAATSANPSHLGNAIDVMA